MGMREVGKFAHRGIEYIVVAYIVRAGPALEMITSLARPRSGREIVRLSNFVD
jgi:hypothetical protein